MKIDSHIATGVERYILDQDITAKEFSRRMNVSEATVIKWRKPGNGVSEPRWNELFKLIRPYLPEDRIYLDDAGQEQYSSLVKGASVKFFEPKFVPQMAPAITEKELLNYECMLESIEQFAIRCNVPRVEYRPRHKDKGGVFALLIESALHEPVFPAGARLFVTSEDAKPANDNTVVCRFRDKNKICIGRYQANDGEFTITPYSKEKPVSGKIAEAKKLIDWVFPVMFYEVVTM